MWNFMDTQTSLGWQEETTIYDRDFDSTTEQLTKSGERHLEYILHVVPVERRSVYIQSTHDPVLDNIRTESVNAVMARMCPDGSEVPVSVRDCQQVGRPASEVQQINTMYNTSTPSPRLGSASGGGATSTP